MDLASTSKQCENLAKYPFIRCEDNSFCLISKSINCNALAVCLVVGICYTEALSNITNRTKDSDSVPCRMRINYELRESRGHE